MAVISANLASRKIVPCIYLGDANGAAPRKGPFKAEIIQFPVASPRQPFASSAELLFALGYGPMPENANKIPCFKGWPSYYPGKPRVPDDIRELIAKYPRAHLGVVCGYNQLLAVDIDTDDQDIIDAILAKLPAWTIAKRGNKGLTIFFRYAGDLERICNRSFYLKGADGKKGAAICEILWHGRKTTIPPTPHAKTGNPYTWVNGEHALFNTPVEKLPEITAAHLEALEAAIGPWTYQPPLRFESGLGKPLNHKPAGLEAKRFRAYAQTVLDARAKDLSGAGEGGRNRMLFDAVCVLGKYVHHGYLDRADMVTRLTAACNHNGLEKSDGGARGIMETIKSGLWTSRNDPLRELKDRPRPKARPQAAEIGGSGNSGTGGDGGATGEDGLDRASAYVRKPGYPPDNIGAIANMKPELTKTGYKSKSYVNCAISIAQHLNVRGHHDIFADRRWILFKGDLVELTDPVCRAIQAEVAADLETDGGSGNVLAVLQYLCELNQFHPVRQYLGGLKLKWDGTERMKVWLEKTFGCTAPPEYLGGVGKMFLISMVARIIQPGCQADYKLIIEGEQGKRKSSALRALVKNPEWFSDALPVLGRDEVRVSMHLRGLWLVEVPEMHATGKADNETVKSFITRRVERYIAKYGRSERYEPRQCIFAGTTNKDAYFTDETGARRYWPIYANEVNLDWLKDNLDQLWAEAVHAYENGVPWWPDAKFEDEHIKPQQSERKEELALEEPIKKYLDDRGDYWPVGEPKAFQFEIWKHLKKDSLKPEIDYTNAHLRDISKALKHLGYTNQPRRCPPDNRVARKWWPPKDKLNPKLDPDADDGIGF